MNPNTQPAGAPGGPPLPSSLHNVPLIPDTPGMRWCPMSKYSSTTQVSCPDSLRREERLSHGLAAGPGDGRLSQRTPRHLGEFSSHQGCSIEPCCEMTPGRCLCASRSREKQGCSLPTEGRCPAKPFPTCTASLGKGHSGTPHPSVHEDKCREQLGSEQATAKPQTGKTSTTSQS